MGKSEEKIRQDLLEELRIKIEKLKTKNNTPTWIASYKGGITNGFDQVLDLLETIY